MQTVRLRSKWQVVTEVKKTTKARLFKDFRVGTVFRITTFVERTTGGSNGLYASYFKVRNKQTDEVKTFSQNELVRYLENFEFSARVKD